MKHVRAQILRFGASYQRQVVVKASGGASGFFCDFMTVLLQWLCFVIMLVLVVVVVVTLLLLFSLLLSLLSSAGE